MLVANEVTQVRLRQRRGRKVEVLDLELGLHRVNHLIVDNRVNRHDNVVGGDHLLRQDVDQRLAHIHPNHAVDERDEEDQTGVGRMAIAAKPNDQALLKLLYDAHAESQGGNRDYEYQH